MDWDTETRSRLETALNESDVVGVRLHPSGSYVDVLLDALSLPPSGPLARDRRRLLRLTAPGVLTFVLRRDAADELPASGAAIPLPDLAAVEEFFATLSWGGSIYGWRFFDEPSLTSDWPPEPSLTVPVRADVPLHTFYWFNECGVADGDDVAAYCIEGTISFDDVHVLDVGEREIATETFIDDGVRHWDALFAHDERLSSESQGAAQRTAITWRPWGAGTSVMGPV